MITEFAEGHPLTPATANTSIIKNIATNIAELHHSSVSFAQASDTFVRITGKYKKLHCLGALKNIIERCWQQVNTIEIQFRNYKVKPVPCHNDLNWGNIFIHDGQVTLIDWGDAALGDPYFDIAALLVLNVINPERESVFLQYYDTLLLTPQWQTYLQHCKQLVYFEFALNLLLGVQGRDKELLYAHYLPHVENVNHYLTLLAEKKVTVDSTFLYHMGIAALNQVIIDKI